ncbi:RxLR-like protein [Plasmopara halstedii]|uniref:RxLR-like protein n=1 Tax=Plasmopara halstedii TaxID=4781 RepID=A0A0N7L7R7_PLAHL|nr:RxLR-like protein [Plasmopara halstedii]CEG47827.1 RxLR-like protein [Plasmopara halstedii]|eukprot:XP_024584196.1 RxLR-like protein [Plasmopara halstedii]
MKFVSSLVLTAVAVTAANATNSNNLRSENSHASDPTTEGDFDWLFESPADVPASKKNFGESDVKSFDAGSSVNDMAWLFGDTHVDILADMKDKSNPESDEIERKRTVSDPMFENMDQILLADTMDATDSSIKQFPLEDFPLFGDKKSEPSDSLLTDANTLPSSNVLNLDLDLAKLMKSPIASDNDGIYAEGNKMESPPDSQHFLFLNDPTEDQIKNLDSTTGESIHTDDDFFLSTDFGSRSPKATIPTMTDDTSFTSTPTTGFGKFGSMINDIIGAITTELSLLSMYEALNGLLSNLIADISKGTFQLTNDAKSLTTKSTEKNQLIDLTYGDEQESMINKLLDMNDPTPVKSTGLKRTVLFVSESALRFDDPLQIKSDSIEESPLQVERA